MSDMSDEELVFTKRHYGVNPSEKEEALAILEHWKCVYDIPIYEIDKVKKLIEK